MAKSIVTVTPNPALDVWLTTPAFKAGQKLRFSRPRVDPGGGSINVSRVLDRLEGDTLALCAARGRRGDELADALEREGVRAERCAIAGETHEDISVCETDSGDVMRFVTPGPELRRDETEALLATPERAAGNASLVVGGGSLPDGAGDSFRAEAAAQCKRAGARFVLDSHHAAGPAFDEGVFCFRENCDAIEGMTGHRIGWPDEAADWAAGQVAARGAEIVIVTEGARMAQQVDGTEAATGAAAGNHG